MSPSIRCATAGVSSEALLSAHKVSTCASYNGSTLFLRSQYLSNSSRKPFPQTKGSRRWQSSTAQAISIAREIARSDASKIHPVLDGVSVDPLKTVAKELKFLTKNIRQLLGSGHPMLDTVAKYYTQAEGKHVRPLLVLLMSKATSLTPRVSRSQSSSNFFSVDDSISPTTILNDINPSLLEKSGVSTPISDRELAAQDSDILPSQRRLAEITELIHTASLLHDDVIDSSNSRRGQPSANIAFGNKMAVLAGDFMLGRASAALARLRDAEVIELLATVIANLVEGEFMQLRNTAQDEKNPTYDPEIITYYLQKTYLKSASLISKSCRAAAILGSHTVEVVDAAYSFGRNLGLAFQLIDDMLDYTITHEELGKPAGADLELGLATAPLLFAWRENPELGRLVGRKFSAEGDVVLARRIVLQSSGIDQTRALAQEYADKAVAALAVLPSSEAKDGLIEMCEKTMKRRK